MDVTSFNNYSGIDNRVHIIRQKYASSNLSPPQRLLLAMITISIEIHFTTLSMADLGTRVEPLGEEAQAGKGVIQPRDADQ